MNTVERFIGTCVRREWPSGIDAEARNLTWIGNPSTPARQVAPRSPRHGNRRTKKIAANKTYVIVEGVKDPPDTETGQGVNAATHVEGEQERVDDAMYMMQRETVQDPVSLAQIPRL